MVAHNSIGKRGGKLYYEIPPKKPRKLLFDVGDYEVSFHKQRGNRVFKYYHCIVWYGKEIVGSIDLSTAYDDVHTILSVNSTIIEPYQGLGIAYRVYEGLVCDCDITIHTNNQSKGAIKMWRKFATNSGLKLYFVDDVGLECFFDCDVYDVRLNETGALEAVNYAGKTINPYARNNGGSLVLVKRDGVTDRMIQKHIPLKQSHRRLVEEFNQTVSLKC